LEAVVAEVESCCGSAAAAWALASGAAVDACPVAAIAARSWDDGEAAPVADTAFEPSAFTASVGVIVPSCLPAVAGCGAALLLPVAAVAAVGSEVAAAAVPGTELFACAGTCALAAAVFAPIGLGVPPVVANTASFVDVASVGVVGAFTGVAVAV
jgi:hypothetical protein